MWKRNCVVATMSDIKCPICQNNLHKINIVVSTCTNDKCKLWGSSIPNLVLEALTQAKQDLEIAKSYVKGISQMVINSGDNIYIVIGHFKKLAEQTLEQIEHKDE